MAEFGRLLRASADAACLQARGIDPASLESRGHDLLVRNGTRMLEVVASVVDAARMRAAFTARTGPGGTAEFIALRNDPDVKRYAGLAEPAKLARLADHIAENIDRHSLLARLGLKRSLSPVASGDERLLNASPEDSSLEAAEAFREKTGSAALRRWIELQDAAGDAYADATDQETAMRFGPAQMTPSLPEDLAAVCIHGPGR